MKVFGLGQLASLGSVDRYARFTQSMYAIYETMEDELDSATRDTPVFHFWSKHSDILRRKHALQQDLNDIASRATPLGQISPKTEDYVNAIKEAGRLDRNDNGGRILGHAYCRYLADLFGGQMLGTPTRWAVGLSEGTPHHYNFNFDSGRRELIENIYNSLNVAGDELGPDKSALIVQEALNAFSHNANVYSEEPMLMDATRGVFNIAGGGVKSLLR
eukprot:g12267.t1